MASCGAGPAMTCGILTAGVPTACDSTRCAARVWDNSACSTWKAVLQSYHVAAIVGVGASLDQDYLTAQSICFPCIFVALDA